MEEYMESELSGIFRVKLVTKNIVRGSPRTQFMHMRVKTILDAVDHRIKDFEAMFKGDIFGTCVGRFFALLISQRFLQRSMLGPLSRKGWLVHI